MNYLTRLSRYFQAMMNLEDLNRTTAQVQNQPRQVVQRTFGYCGGFLEPIQVEDEITRLLDDVQHLQPHRVLEIGTSMGGTLYLWTRVAQNDAVIVSIDLPGGKFGGGYSRLRTPLYQRFARDHQTMHLLRADSHAPGTLGQVRQLFGTTPVDFLFIDGDHTYEGVRQDWENYSPLVRPGGLVAFHDVGMNYDDTQVKRFWDEIKTGFPYREYLAHERGFYGIGVVQK